MKLRRVNPLKIKVWEIDKWLFWHIHWYRRYIIRRDIIKGKLPQTSVEYADAMLEASRILYKKNPTIFTEEILKNEAETR